MNLYRLRPWPTSHEEGSVRGFGVCKSVQDIPEIYLSISWEIFIYSTPTRSDSCPEIWVFCPRHDHAWFQKVGLKLAESVLEIPQNCWKYTFQTSTGYLFFWRRFGWLAALALKVVSSFFPNYHIILFLFLSLHYFSHSLFTCDLCIFSTSRTAIPDWVTAIRMAFLVE